MKLVRIAIFLTGISGLALGGIMTLSSLRANQEEATIGANETLKSEATQFVDQFFSVIEATKNLTPSTANLPSYISNRAVAKLNQGVVSEFESFASTDAATPANAQPDFGLQERVISAVKAEVSIPDLQISRIAMGTYPLTDTGTHEGIYVVTPIYKINGNGQIDPSMIDKLNISLIDPGKAFGGLQKIHSSQEEAGYLISKKGKVLAHTVSAYVGTDMKHIDKLKDSVDSLFVGAQTGTVGKYKNVDGVEEQVAFVRAGTSPFAFGVEQRAHPAVLSGAWFSDQAASGAARKNVGILFITLAFGLVGFAGAGIWTSRLVKAQIQNSAQARAISNQETAELIPSLNEAFTPHKIAPSILKAERKSRAQPIPEESAEIPMPLNVTESANHFVQAREQKMNVQDQMNSSVQGLSAPRDTVRDFLTKIEKSYTIEGVEKELVQVTSEVADSPILYFRYHRRNQSLTLSSVAGEVKIPNYSHMQVYVRKDIELQVEHMADEGKVASISNYAPMNKLVSMHLNVAHFEAWGVTSEPSVSGQSRLVGVLVVLQAGMRSAQARPMLAKIFKGAGNYLYAQSNKIRPRTNSTTPQVNPMPWDQSNLS